MCELALTNAYKVGLCKESGGYTYFYGCTNIDRPGKSAPTASTPLQTYTYTHTHTHTHTLPHTRTHTCKHTLTHTAALPSMMGIVCRRPKHFASQEAAVRWALKSGMCKSRWECAGNGVQDGKSVCKGLWGCANVCEGVQERKSVQVCARNVGDV